MFNNVQLLDNRSGGAAARSEVHLSSLAEEPVAVAETNKQTNKENLPERKPYVSPYQQGEDLE